MYQNDVLSKDGSMAENNERIYSVSNQKLVNLTFLKLQTTSQPFMRRRLISRQNGRQTGILRSRSNKY